MAHTKDQRTALTAIRRASEYYDHRKSAVEQARADLAVRFAEGAALGLSQQRMANEAGISQSWVKLLIRDVN